MSFAQEIKPALADTSASPLQRAIIRELAKQPQGAPDLTTRLGLRHFVQVNGALGSLGRHVRRKLTGHPEGLPDGECQWWHVLATGEKHARGWVWTLRPDVRTAAAELGWLEDSEFSLPEEAYANDARVEGALRTILVNRYERDPHLRKACISHCGARCFVCAIDLGEEYGNYALGFIHVHHLTPLSEMKGGAIINPVEDLRPLCPNCHAVVHLQMPAFTMEKMKEMRASSKRETTAERSKNSCGAA